MSNLEVVSSHNFSGFKFFLVREPEYRWHALQIDKFDDDGSSINLMLNCGDPEEIQKLGIFLVQAAAQIRNASKQDGAGQERAE